MARLLITPGTRDMAAPTWSAAPPRTAGLRWRVLLVAGWRVVASSQAGGWVLRRGP